MLKLKLHWQILIALILAALAGILTSNEPWVIGNWHLPNTPTVFGIAWTAVYGFLGQMFLNLLMMLIVPLIASSIIVGVTGIGHTQNFARLGIKTVIWYAMTSLAAILVGLTLINAIGPGWGADIAGNAAAQAESAKVLARVGNRGLGEIVNVILGIVPRNIVAAASGQDMLSLIFFALLFGYFTLKIPAELQTTMINFWKAVYEIMLRMTDWVMLFAPIGVFGLVAKVVAETGFGAFANVAWFFLTVMLALAVHMFVVLPVLMLLLGRVKPHRHYRAMAPALLTAFSTASSSATLPVTIDCVERRAGVSNRIASFVLPLGATVNMDGTALYECSVVIFIAQAYGKHLPFATQFLVVLLALLTSIGVAGVPAASLVAIAIILHAVGLPLEAIGLVMVVDRILDMCRTSVNIFSDSCGAVVIARTEGETDVLAAPAV